MGDTIDLYEKEGGWKRRFRTGLRYRRQAGHSLLLTLFWGGVLRIGSLRIIWRYFKRLKPPPVINISGLAVGGAAFMLAGGLALAIACLHFSSGHKNIPGGSGPIAEA